jgi:hypothetical protein
MNRADLIIGLAASFILGLICAAIIAAIAPRGPSSEDVIQAYQQGRADALKTNPASDELERVCVGLWADSLPVRP